MSIGQEDGNRSKLNKAEVVALHVVYAQKMLIAMDVIQTLVQTMIFVRTKNVRLQRD